MNPGYIKTSSLILLFLLLLCTASPATSDDTVFTLWPVIDYRSSERVDYSSLHLLGPLIKFEKKESEVEWGLRPLWYHAELPDQGVTLNEVLFPLYQRTHSPESTKSSLFSLFRSESSPDERSFSLYPLIFYRTSETRGDELAFFPIAGHLENRLGRRKIDFALFPLYSRTVRYAGTRTHNVLWPVFSVKSGPDNESGWGVWPLYGQGSQDRHYRERFFLWPFFIFRDEFRDGEFVAASRTFFPFFIYRSAPDQVETTVLWPFFVYREDGRDGYREWDVPWPLVRLSRGEGKHTNRFFPFYSDETFRQVRTRWYVWPLYKHEQKWTPDYNLTRHRVLFFLANNLRQSDPETGEIDRRHVSVWPLMTFIQHGQVRELRILSILDPIFPERPPLERNWEPLWRLYVRRWDPYGNAATSVLWNLYWQETRGDDVARELFPLFDYRREGANINLGFLKGLFRYKRVDGETRLSFFFF